MIDSQRSPRVFLSYSHDSGAHRGRVLALAMRLRDEGVDAWLDRCVQSPAEGWIRWMEREVEAADFVLVVCTPTYRRRFEGKEDEGKGLGVSFEGSTIQKLIYADGQRNEKYVPVLFEDGTDAVPLQLVDVMRYRLPRDYEALYRRLTDQPEVVLGVLGALRKLPPRATDGSQHVAWPANSVASLPRVEISPGPPASVPRNLPPRSEFFRGRVRELRELHLTLGAEGQLGVTQRVAAWAHGGVGKTALALEYGWQHLPDYPGGVFLVPADTEIIEPALAALAGDFKPEVDLTGSDKAETAENVRRHLTRGQKALLILDNVRDGEQLRKWKGALPSEACRLLLTTRGEKLPGIKMWQLERLNDADAIELLSAHRPDATAPEHRGSVDVVLRACDGLAVAVVAVGAYLALNVHLTWRTYANRLRHEGEAMLEKTIEVTAEDSEYQLPLSVIFSDLFGALRAPQRRCLLVAALLPTDQIPRSWLSRILAEEPGLQLEVAPGEADPTVAVLESLLRLQLLRVADEEGLFLTMHRLLGYWLRKTPEASLKDELIGRVSGFAMERAKAVFDAVTHPELRWELRPLVALCQLLLEWERSEEAALLANWVSPPLQGLGRQREIQTLLATLLSQRTGEHPQTLTARKNLAQTLYAQGDLAGARGHQEAVLEALRQRLGDEHAQTLIARLNLAQTLYAQGDLAAALNHQEAVLEAMRRLLGEEHPHTLTARLNLAGTLYAQGDLAGALAHEEAVLEARRQRLGEEHPDTLIARNNLAQTLSAQGDLAAALSHQEAVLEATRRLLGEEHPDTLAARNNLAQMLSAQGDLAGAFSHQEAVLEATRRLLGDEHPQTLTARNNLAGTLSAQGDLAGALSRQEAVLEARRRLLGDGHPDTLTARNNLAQTLYAQGDLAGALSHQEAVLEAMRRLLGHEHPDTLTARLNLASTLYEQGDLAGALAHEEAVLEAMRRLLGDEHPETLRARGNLSLTLKALMAQGAS